LINDQEDDGYGSRIPSRHSGVHFLSCQPKLKLLRRSSLDHIYYFTLDILTMIFMSHAVGRLRVYFNVGE